MSKLLLKLAQGGGLSLLRIVCGIAKVKVMATALGVTGVGISSLLLQFQMVAISLISMGMSLGVINLGRPAFNLGDLGRAGAVASTATVIVSVNAILGGLGIWVFEQPIREQLLGGGAANFTLWPLILAALLAAYASGVVEGVIFMANRFDRYILGSAVAVVVEAIAFTWATWNYGLQGVVFATLASALALLFVFLICVFTARESRGLLANFRFDRRLVAPLLGFSGLMLATTTVSIAASMVSRAMVLERSGPFTNGLLQVATSLAAYLLPFFSTGVHGHLYPMASAQGDTLIVRRELNKTLSLCSPLAASACIATILVAPLLIPLAYSPEFLAARPYLSLYFAGEFIFIINSVYGIYLLAISRRFNYLLGVLAYAATLLAVVALLRTTAGGWSYVIGHIVAVVCAFAVNLLTAKRRHHFDRALILKILADWALVIVVSALSFTEAERSSGSVLTLLVGFAAVSLMLARPIKDWYLARHNPRG